MVSVLHRRLLRELRGGGMPIVSIVLIAAVGTGCYVAMRSAHRNLSDAKNRYYAQGRMADFWIQLKKVPTDEVSRLRELPWVTEIQSRLRFPVTADLGEDRKPISGLALSLPDARRPVLNDVVLRRGGYFTPGRRNWPQGCIACRFVWRRRCLSGPGCGNGWPTSGWRWR